ncbi:carbohydrate ABC transporter permease [Cohnella silvisoli]|uniref:Sugar ABC transporter permease n=1 Tax=Cohnella silvisoli TaxID=2873699 RepID=A0ABV1KS07_9BACL|nr:sugar ABC transporter permease [Cohnella silvisoli]MCD9022442.1 sugar ABC transporter permease [Cohnella silvisoli]
MLHILRKSWYQKTSTQKHIFILIAIGPALLGYLLFTLYPNITSVYYSLLYWTGVTKPDYVGFDNYVKIAHDHFFWNALYHNFLYTLIIPPLILIISLFLAYLLTYKGYRESSFYKVLYFFPNVLPVVVISLLWAFIYDGNFGLINAFLKMISIDIGEYYWLGHEKTAFWAIIPPTVWAGVGFYVVIIMNAMAAIPKSLYESAILEGASHTQRLYHITIPLINGVLRVCLLFIVLGLFRNFELILVLTNGGPSGSTDVVGLYMFNYAFGSKVGTATIHDYGYASAIGMCLFVILISIKLIMDKFLPDKTVEF